jgi:hypothetical protein
VTRVAGAKAYAAKLAASPMPTAKFNQHENGYHVYVICSFKSIQTQPSHGTKGSCSIFYNSFHKLLLSKEVDEEQLQ